MTHEHLDKCRHLLPDPAPEVVRELVNDLRRYVTAMDAIYNAAIGALKGALEP